MNIPYVFKKCSKCGRWLVASKVNFYKNKNGKYGLFSYCKECMNDRNKKHYEENKEYYKNHYQENKNYFSEYQKKYREENKEKIAKQKKKYREKHKEETLEYRKKYNKENKEKIAQYNKKYYEENKEYYAEHFKNWSHSPQGQTSKLNNHHKRRQTKEQQGNGITPDQWLEMMKFFGFKCAYSDITLNADTRSIDHIVPLAKGGEHEIWNCVPMDRSLNSSKNNKDIKEWYTQQDFYDEDKLNKINEWHKYAYNKWGKEVNTKAI